MFNQGQQVQNVPNGVAQQARQNQDQRQQGFGKYIPSDNSLNSLLTAPPQDVSFDFDQASGAFQLVDRRQQPANPASSNQPNGQQQANTQPASQPNGNGNGTDQYKDRFAAIDQQFSNIGQALQRMAAYMEGFGTRQPQGQQQDQQQQPVTLDLQSEDFTTNLLNIISTAIDRKFKTFEEKLAPIQQTNTQMNDRMLLADLAMKHGQKLLDIMPTLQELKNSDPNLNLEVAANALLKLPITKTDSTIRPDNGNNQQAQGVQPQSVDQNQLLQQRANQLQTESGGVPHNVVNQEPQINTIADAVNKSFRDLGIG